MSVWANRVIILLSWLGIYIAGVLSYSKAAKLLVPCQVGHSDCATVAVSKYADLFGVPVAYIGLGGYLLLLALAVGRLFVPKLWGKLGLISIVTCGLGVGFSAYLTVMSLSQLHTSCAWCLGSFGTMTLMFLAHGVMLQGKDLPTRILSLDTGTFFVGLVISAIMLSTTTQQMINGGSGTELKLPQGITEKDVLGPDYKWKGNKDAKVSLIEFADFNCPACRQSAPDVEKVYKKYGGKLRWVFRNLPLNIPGHESSTRAALFAEMAAEKGKYWDWVETVFEPGNMERVKDKSGDGIKAIANELKLDGSDFSKRADSGVDKALDPISDDMAMAQSLALGSTPTFIIQADGLRPRQVQSNEFEQVLNAEPYKSMLGN